MCICIILHQGLKNTSPVRINVASDTLKGLTDFANMYLFSMFSSIVFAR